MKILRKIMAVLLAIITVITSGALTCTPSAAAYSSALSSDIDAYLPIVTYATPSSGKSRIYPYKDSSCKSKLSNYWIDCYTEQIVVRDITANGKYAYVAIPSASGYKSFWFDTDDIFGLASIMLKDMYAKNSKNDPVKVYRLTGSSKKTSYGSFWEWDCHVLGTYKISGTTYYKTIYELSSSTKVNGVSGIKHKLGLITSSAYKALTTPTSTNSNNSNNNSSNNSSTSENKSQSTKTSSTLSAKSAAKLNIILNMSAYKDGATWGNLTPKLSEYDCKQCCAYVADLVAYIYDVETPVSGTKYTNVNEIRAGDVVKLKNTQHWFFVIARHSDGTLEVAEGNVGTPREVRVTNGYDKGSYKIKNGKLYVNYGSKDEFWAFDAGWHFE